MTIWRSGIYISLFVVICIVGLHIFSYKPRFVVPQTQSTRAYTIMHVIGIILLICMPLDIHIPNRHITVQQIAPIQILFDVSLSMAASDIAPSRFSAAKGMVDQLLQGWESNPISIILFSGIPFVHIPFSDVTQAVRAKWDSTHLGQFPPVIQFVGTAIGDALLLGMQNIENNYSSGGIIILITDGDSNKGYEPGDVIALLQKKQIPVYTIGIGKPEYFIVGYDYFGQQVLTTYNPEFLQHLSDTTGGKSWILQDNAAVEDTIQDIIQTLQSRMEMTDTYTQFPINKILIVLFIVRMITLSARRGWARYRYK